MSPSSTEGLKLQEPIADETLDCISDLEDKQQVSEEDLHELAKKIQEKNLSREKLTKAMHLIGIILMEKPEKWLQEHGKGLIQAAYARAKDHNLHHSLPDNGTQALIIDTEKREFNNSLIFEKVDYEDMETVEQEDGKEVEGDQEEGLELSGIFKTDAGQEDQVSGVEEPILETVIELRKTVSERLKNIPSINITTNNEFIVQLRWNQEEKKEELQVVFDLLEELKMAMNVFLEEVHEELAILQHAPIENYSGLFHDKNHQLIQQILEVDVMLSDEESQGKEILEQRSPGFNLTQSVNLAEDVPKDLRLLKQLMETHAITVLREQFFYLDHADLNREETTRVERETEMIKTLKTRLNEILQKMSRIKAVFPDPWEE